MAIQRHENDRLEGGLPYDVSPENIQRNFRRGVANRVYELQSRGIAATVSPEDLFEILAAGSAELAELDAKTYGFVTAMLQQLDSLAMNDGSRGNPALNSSAALFNLSGPGGGEFSACLVGSAEGLFMKFYLARLRALALYYFSCQQEIAPRLTRGLVLAGSIVFRNGSREGPAWLYENMDDSMRAAFAREEELARIGSLPPELVERIRAAIEGDLNWTEGRRRSQEGAAIASELLASNEKAREFIRVIADGITAPLVERGLITAVP